MFEGRGVKAPRFLTMIPLSWKCKSAITKLEKTILGDMRILVGCEENYFIRCYEDAQEMCPLIQDDNNET